LRGRLRTDDDRVSVQSEIARERLTVAFKEQTLPVVAIAVVILRYFTFRALFVVAPDLPEGPLKRGFLRVLVFRGDLCGASVRAY